MAAPEHFQRFASGPHAALPHVFHAFTDAFQSIAVGGDIHEAPIGFGILHDRFGLSIDGENERFFGLFEMLHVDRSSLPSHGKAGFGFFGLSLLIAALFPLEKDHIPAGSQHE
jgi:hypothetical protein